MTTPTVDNLFILEFINGLQMIGVYEESDESDDPFFNINRPFRFQVVKGSDSSPRMFLAPLLSFMPPRQQANQTIPFNIQTVVWAKPVGSLVDAEGAESLLKMYIQNTSSLILS